MDQRPIGVFDSGLGGVSTLIQARAMLPRENYIYYGDNGNAPYGGRSKKDIQRLALSACHFLVEHDVKALLIACNTATTAAIELLEKEMPVPVIGMEPAILQAEAEAEKGIVLMMATEATVRLPHYRKLREQLKNQTSVKDVPCPEELVRRVECGLLEPGSYDDLLKDVFAEFEGRLVDGIVLGCTHYLFVQPEIERYAAAHFQGAPRFYDGGRVSAAAMREVLFAQGMTNSTGNAEVTFYTSGDPVEMRPLFNRLFAWRIQ